MKKTRWTGLLLSFALLGTPALCTACGSAEQTNPTGQAESSEQAESAEQTDSADQTESAEQGEATDSKEQTESTDSDGQTESAEQMGREDQEAQEAQAESADREAVTDDEDQTEGNEQAESADGDAAESEDAPGNGAAGRKGMAGGGMGSSIIEAKSGDTELQEMIAEVADAFTEDGYTDEETGLSVPYDIYLPEGYDQGEPCPMMVFIGDMTTAGSEMDYSLKQGWGGIVWATAEEQSKHRSIVLVPVYPETILDDHDGYVTTDYVDLTPRMIASVAEKYHADTSRIYGTGQSMGAMTTLLLAAKNPELYAAVLIVDGQWDVDELKGLESQHMIYVAAGGDEKAAQGQEDVKTMLASDGVAYSEISGLDAQADRAELDAAVAEMLEEGNSINFVTWEAGSVLVGSSLSSEHMASFDYGYKLPAIRDWVYEQS